MLVLAAPLLALLQVLVKFVAQTTASAEVGPYGEVSASNIRQQVSGARGVLTFYCLYFYFYPKAIAFIEKRIMRFIRL